MSPGAGRSAFLEKIMAESAGRVCDVDGCGRPHRARGLCSTHYNQAHQPDRHRKVTVQCAQCGAVCEKEPTRAKRYRHLFCSDACKVAHPSWRESNATSRSEIYARQKKHAAARRLAQAATGVRGHGVWTVGHCAQCGEAFTRHSPSGTPTFWCSRDCRSASKGNGRYRRRVPPARARKVFERDGWRCHLCRKQTDRSKRWPHPDAPTIDHVVPKSAGGGDEAENLATAHWRCNLQRLDGGTVQLALIG